MIKTRSAEVREPRRCPICKKEFIPRHSHQKYCNEGCRKAARRQELEPRRCAFCGEEFMPRQANQIYCKRRCTQKASDKRRDYSQRTRKKAKAKVRTVKLEERQCLKCGETFTQSFVGDKFCCDEHCWEYYSPELRAAFVKVLGEVIRGRSKSCQSVQTR